MLNISFHNIKNTKWKSIIYLKYNYFGNMSSKNDSKQNESLVHLNFTCELLIISFYII